MLRNRAIEKPEPEPLPLTHISANSYRCRSVQSDSKATHHRCINGFSQASSGSRSNQHSFGVTLAHATKLRGRNPPKRRQGILTWLAARDYAAGARPLVPRLWRRRCLSDPRGVFFQNGLPVRTWDQVPSETHPRVQARDHSAIGHNDAKLTPKIAPVP